MHPDPGPAIALCTPLVLPCVLVVPAGVRLFPSASTKRNPRGPSKVASSNAQIVAENPMGVTRLASLASAAMTKPSSPLKRRRAVMGRERGVAVLRVAKQNQVLPIAAHARRGVVWSGVVWCAEGAVTRRQRPGCLAYGHSKTGRGVYVCARRLGSPLRPAALGTPCRSACPCLCSSCRALTMVPPGLAGA